MLKTRFLPPVLLLSLFMAGCSPGLLWRSAGTYGQVQPVLDKLWQTTVQPTLAEDLWHKRDIYDAGHYLMVPLHAAFSSQGRQAWRDQFHHHFARFANYHGDLLETGRLNALQYAYLTSRYLVLAASRGESKRFFPLLERRLLNTLNKLWRTQPAWQWGREPFKNMAARLRWKLAHSEVKKSYYRALIDEELFVFAIAADLSTYAQRCGSSVDPLLSEIVALADEAFSNEFVWQPDGGVLLQPGVWADHPDYAFAGVQAKKANLQPSPIAGIATDSSHSHRLPLWLLSMQQAFAHNPERFLYYSTLRQGVALQFLHKVLLSPKGEPVKLANYMDGHNGIYRWNYATLASGDGYGPAQLSGTFLLGWWSFLGEPVREIYRGMVGYFPLSPEYVKFYVGPNTSRDRNPLMRWPDAFDNGYIELLIRLAGATKWEWE